MKTYLKKMYVTLKQGGRSSVQLNISTMIRFIASKLVVVQIWGVFASSKGARLSGNRGVFCI